MAAEPGKELQTPPDSGDADGEAWPGLHEEQANAALVQALRECDLEAIARLAGIAPSHTAGDRLALLQALFRQVPDPEMRDRLEDFAGVIALNPLLCSGAREVVAETRRRLVDEFGPFSVEFLAPEAILLGFLKEPSPRRRIAEELGIGDWAVLRLFLPAMEPDWDAPMLPPSNYLVAFWRKCADMDTGIAKVTLRRALVGTTTLWSGLRSCTRCSGEGRIPCPDCQGHGIQGSEAIRKSTDGATHSQRREMARVTNAEGYIGYDALRRILGAKAVECQTCQGTGGERCACAVDIEVPAGARVDWICRFLDHNRRVAGWGRIKTME